MGMAAAASYDPLARVYHEAIDPDGVGLRDPVFDDLVGAIDGQQVLAVACGQGRDARLLADLGATVVGVDISEGLLAYARDIEAAAPRGIRYVTGDAESLADFAPAEFDGAVCHMALMDIPDLDRAIGSVARVLRPGGWFVCAVVHPCFRPHLDVIAGYQVEGRYQKIDGWHALPRHAYHRMLSSYLNALSGAGLLVTRMVEPLDGPPAGSDVPNVLYLRCRKTAPDG